MTGEVEIERCSSTFEPDKIDNLNTNVFSGPRTRGISEIGLSPYIMAFANEDFRAYTLIAVFPLCIFRHKSIFVHSDSGFDDPAQLKGKRIGTPGYLSTSLTWIRGAGIGWILTRCLIVWLIEHLLFSMIRVKAR